MKTTNYFNAFIEVAEDCPAKKAEIPPIKGDKTVANIQYELITQDPSFYFRRYIISRLYYQKQPTWNRNRETLVFFQRPSLSTFITAGKTIWLGNTLQ